jgi:hypothetical protein
MAETSCERQVVLSKYLDGVDDMLIYSGTTGHINSRFRKVSSNVYENENGNLIIFFDKNNCFLVLR